MYPYYLLFDPARREEEESRFWLIEELAARPLREIEVEAPGLRLRMRR
jgi:hypothetical protein